MTNDSEYVRNLEDTLAQYLKPLKGLAFPVVIRALTRKAVLPFDKSSPPLKSLLLKLESGVSGAGLKANHAGIFARRANEVGNAMEAFLEDGLDAVGLPAGKPLTTGGRRQSSGYPDFEISYQGAEVYLDCKTYEVGKENQTLRTFYFSASDKLKVTKDGHHLLVAFGMTPTERDGKACRVPVKWAIYDLFALKVQVKHEFNASNRDIYKTLQPLASGKIA